MIEDKLISMEEMLEQHRKLSVSELMDNMAEARDIMAILAEILNPIPNHRHSLMLLALLFGSMCADAEMEHPERSYQDRLALFMVHAETGYREAIQFIKDNPVYNKPKGALH